MHILDFYFYLGVEIYNSVKVMVNPHSLGSLSPLGLCSPLTLLRIRGCFENIRNTVALAVVT